MADTLIRSLPKEGIVMDKLMKLHMGIIIGVLAFTLGILGFFLVQFIEKVNVMDTRLSTVENNTNVLMNDVAWIKTFLMTSDTK